MYGKNRPDIVKSALYELYRVQYYVFLIEVEMGYDTGDEDEDKETASLEREYQKVIRLDDYENWHLRSKKINALWKSAHIAHYILENAEKVDGSNLGRMEYSAKVITHLRTTLTMLGQKLKKPNIKKAIEGLPQGRFKITVEALEKSLNDGEITAIDPTQWRFALVYYGELSRKLLMDIYKGEKDASDDTWV